MRIVTLGLGALAMVAATASIARDRKAEVVTDPDKIICKTQQDTGSRLARTKRCMSARDWAAEKAINQQDIERVQANRYKNG